MASQTFQAARSALGAGSELRAAVARARRLAAEHAPRPPEHGLVLDVGGGDAPHPRADCVVDRYVVDDFERGGETTLSLARPLVVADGEALPFESSSIDYLIASHVLEHAKDPEKFAGELSRVAREGFVQVPSRAAELTFGWRFHPWLVERSGDTLVFHPRNGQIAPLGEVFHDAIATSRLFGLWFASTRSLWHHSIHWTDEICVEVHGRGQAESTAELDVDQTIATLERLSRQGLVQGPPAHVSEVLRCPQDHGSLTEAPDRLVCVDCERSYPVAGAVPVLLKEAAG
jgi:SAM-dependent methyltransferase